MRLRLKPSDSGLLALLTALAQHLPRAADLLGQVVGAHPAERASISERLRAVENEADHAAHAVLTRLSETFVTPFESPDIYLLTSRLDDCVDQLDEVAEHIVLYRIGDLPPAVVRQVEILQRCAELTAEAVGRLRTLHRLREYWIEINRLENDAAELHRELLRSLFDGTSPAGSDPIRVLALKEVVDDVEAAIDTFEAVASVIESIALKEG